MIGRKWRTGAVSGVCHPTSTNLGDKDSLEENWSDSFDSFVAYINDGFHLINRRHGRPGRT